MPLENYLILLLSSFHLQLMPSAWKKIESSVDAIQLFASSTSL